MTGVVSSIKGSVPGNLELTVVTSRNLMRDHLPTQQKHVQILLTDCLQFEYRPYESPPVIDLAMIASSELELLSATSGEENIKVTCADGGYGGELVLRYSSAQIRT